MAREFSSGRKFTEKGLDAVIARKWRELESFINSGTVRFDDDGTVTLPSGLVVTGDVAPSGQVKLATGSVSAPPLTFASYPELGMYPISTTRLGFSIGDQRAFIFETSGDQTRLIPYDATSNFYDTYVQYDDSDATWSLVVNGTTVASFTTSGGSSITQEAWTESLSMDNSWVDYDGGTTYNKAGYMKDSLGFVHLRGMIKNGTASQIYTLPAGYRPAKQQMFPGITFDKAICRIDVTSAGVLNVYNYSTTYVSLSGITFPAA